VPERRLAVIGHPLAAPENRLAFAGWNGCAVDLIVPRAWKARGLGHTYRAPEPSPGRPGVPALHALPVIASGRNSLFLWSGLDPLLARLRPDALYCWEEPWCLATRQVAACARSLRIPWWFYTAENRPKRLPWPFTLAQRAAFASARGCIAPTREIADRIRAAGYAGPVAEVPLWIRPRRALPRVPEARLLAYVGRLIPLKRVDLLIEALVSLPEFRLRIIGDGPERGRLQELAEARGLASRVEFHGHVPNENLEDALEGASLLVLPTGENARQAEQFGKAAVEGVACGLPVLAHRAGNLEALARSFPTLAAGDLDSPRALAEAARAIHRAYPSAEALLEARRKAEAEYGPAAAARALQAAFSLLPDPFPVSREAGA
jgi:glycosyltransferase involved in cell wall biosynthesis